MSNLTEYEQGCAHAWDVMQQLARQSLEILKRIAPTDANKSTYPNLFSSITYEEGQEMARKLLPQDGDEVKIIYPETNKTRLGYVAYVLNPSYIKVFIPDTLEFVTWTFPNKNVVKTGVNKRDEMMALWQAIEAFGGKTNDGSGIAGV